MSLFNILKKTDKPLTGTKLDKSVPFEPWLMDFQSNATEQDVHACFRLILGRNPSKEEWVGHVSTMVGSKLENVMLSYLRSLEFKNRDLKEVNIEDIELIDVFDYQMYVPKHDPHVGAQLYKHRVYEYHLTAFLQQQLAKGDYFLDLGANIGYFTCLAASLVGESGKVMAFEPFAENVKFLHLNQNVNQFDQIEIFPMAVADDNKLCLFDNSGSNGFIRDMSDRVSRVVASTPVYSTKLDDALKAVPRIDMIKIDTEGAEFLALSGAKMLLEKHCPVIISEFTPDALRGISGVSAHEYLNLLLINDDYQLYAFIGESLVPCVRDIEKLCALFNSTGVEHIDIVASPYALVNQ